MTMRRRSDMTLWAMAVLMLAIVLVPLLINLLQILRDPPPQHPDLVLFGIVGDAIDRLAHVVLVAAVVVVLGAIVARLRRQRTTMGLVRDT